MYKCIYFYFNECLHNVRSEKTLWIKTVLAAGGTKASIFLPA